MGLLSPFSYGLFRVFPHLVWKEFGQGIVQGIHIVQSSCGCGWQIQVAWHDKIALVSLLHW